MVPWYSVKFLPHQIDCILTVAIDRCRSMRETGAPPAREIPLLWAIPVIQSRSLLLQRVLRLQRHSLLISRQIIHHHQRPWDYRQPLYHHSLITNQPINSIDRIVRRLRSLQRQEISIFAPKWSLSYWSTQKQTFHATPTFTSKRSNFQTFLLSPRPKQTAEFGVSVKRAMISLEWLCVQCVSAGVTCHAIC